MLHAHEGVHTPGAGHAHFELSSAAIRKVSLSNQRRQCHRPEKSFTVMLVFEDVLCQVGPRCMMIMMVGLSVVGDDVDNCDGDPNL